MCPTIRWNKAQYLLQDPLPLTKLPYDTGITYALPRTARALSPELQLIPTQKPGKTASRVCNLTNR